MSALGRLPMLATSKQPRSPVEPYQPFPQFALLAEQTDPLPSSRETVAELAAALTILPGVAVTRAESLAGVAVKLRVLRAVVGEGPGILDSAGQMNAPAVLPDAEGFEALKPEYLLFRLVEDCRAAGHTL